MKGLVISIPMDGLIHMVVAYMYTTRFPGAAEYCFSTAGVHFQETKGYPLAPLKVDTLQGNCIL